MEPTHPDRLVENVTAPSAGGFPGSDGEDSRRDRRGRRGVLGGEKRDLHRSRFQQLPWSTESVSLKITPQKVGCRAWNLPTPIGWSKTSPRPLREPFRVRMGQPGWESGCLFGQPLARGRPKRSSDPDGEVSRRDRRGRRGVLGGGKRDLHRSRFQQLPWSTESVSLKIPPQK